MIRNYKCFRLQTITKKTSFFFFKFDSSKIMSKENGAISLLCKAVELDTKKQYTSALVCYKEGLTMLMDIIKGTQVEAGFVKC